MELTELVAGFRRALLRQEFSLSTIETYEWALKDFLRFATAHGVSATDRLYRELIEDWQDQARDRWARRTRSLVSTALRQLLRWGVGRGQIDPHAPYWVTHVKGTRGHPRPIPPDDLHRILSYLARRRFVGSLVDLRNRALFLYILSTGARAFEAAQVMRADMARAIVRQKGGGNKDLDVPPIVLEALQEYLDERRDPHPWMWVTLDTNHPMRPLPPDAMLEIWRRLADLIGVKPWTTHQLRHTGATELYEADIDGLVVADWLGHKGMGHVDQYTRVSRRRRAAAIDVMQKLIERNAAPMPRPLLMPKRGSRRGDRNKDRPE